MIILSEKAVMNAVKRINESRGNLEEVNQVPDNVQEDFTNWISTKANQQQQFGQNSVLGLMYDYYFNDNDQALYEIVEQYKNEMGIQTEEDSNEDIYLYNQIRLAVEAWGKYANDSEDEPETMGDLEEGGDMTEGNEPDGIQNDKYYYIRSGSSHVIDLKMKGEYINMCAHQGNCDDDVMRVIELPEIKSQLDAINDAQLDAWWNEFFCDDTPEEHSAADRNTKLMWLVFDACASAIDGDFEEADDATDDSSEMAMLKETIKSMIRESLYNTGMMGQPMMPQRPVDTQERGHGTWKSQHNNQNLHFKEKPKTGKERRQSKRATVIRWLRDPSVNCAEIMRLLWDPAPEDEDTKRGEFYKKRDGAINKDSGARYSFSDEEINSLYKIKSGRA